GARPEAVSHARSVGVDAALSACAIMAVFLAAAVLTPGVLSLRSLYTGSTHGSGPRGSSLHPRSEECVRRAGLRHCLTLMHHGLLKRRKRSHGSYPRAVADVAGSRLGILGLAVAHDVADAGADRDEGHGAGDNLKRGGDEDQHENLLLFSYPRRIQPL